jgi:hypothetical protein
MVLSTTTCYAPCNVTATITWTNTGDGTGSFEPAIIVNGIRTGTGTNHNLAGGAIYTQVFNLNNLTINTYSICPDLNP